MKNNAGFTIMEGVISALLLGATVAFLYNTIISMQTTIYMSGNHIEAQTIAVDEAIKTLHMPYDDLTHRAGVTTNAVAADSRLFGLGGTIRTAVTSYSNRCDIIVRVDWRQRAAGTDHALFETYEVTRYNTSRL